MTTNDVGAAVIVLAVLIAIVCGWVATREARRCKRECGEWREDGLLIAVYRCDRCRR